ncbi:MAG: ABC transporter ATP-binding protein, partial [Deltaproteobacteria bacterium]|nr:ABC transporter ATP-binding protein [Deltaproteobacteria bacterium]
MPAVLSVKALLRVYGEKVAVDDVSFEVGRNETVGLLGPNGAGKTTTIKMLTGLYEPSSGACLVNGFDVRAKPVKAKRSFGYVPDQPYLYEKLTGREFLYFVGGLFEVPAETMRERIEGLVERFELQRFIDKRAEEYSQGMRQRIVLSSALLHDPLVLIIDEPLVGLDPRSARLVKDTLKQKTREGTTVFMSTHLLEIVEELCDRIAIIKDGRLIHDETQTSGRTFNGQLEAIFLE